ncbi:MAG: CvpA family protein [Arsenophonus sp.]|nr:MAG: CvpA family protein [Arsenophonus sp.]
MVWIDYCIIAIILFSALLSLIRGFIREAMSLITWGGAFFIASQFHNNVSYYLKIIQDIFLRKAIAITILFVTTLIIGATVNYLINTLIKKTGLSSTDRILGVCFGTLRGILIVLAILFFLDTFTPFPNHEAWKNSELIFQFNDIIQWFFNYLRNNSIFLQKILLN